MSGHHEGHNERVSLLERVLTHAVLLIMTAFALYPILWVVSLALSPAGAPDARVLPLPRTISFDHFNELFGTDADARVLFAHQLTNSLVVALVTSVSAIALAAPASYALARRQFVGKETGLSVLLATQMFPAALSLLPLYMILEVFGLTDSRSGLVIVYATTAVPFAIFQLKSAFEAVPREIEEAARTDGATDFQTFYLVALPAVRPALATTALFAFMLAWNEYVLAATLLTEESSYTLPIVLARYVGEHSARWGTFAAGAIVVSVPVMAFFYLVQRHIVTGITAGSVKG